MTRNKILFGLFENWRSKVQGCLLPARADISPCELRTLLPFLFLADVKAGGEIALRLVGTHIEQVLGCDLTGCALHGAHNRWADFAVQRDFFEVAENCSAIVATHELRPATTGARGDLATHKLAVLRYDRLVLPLSADGERVDMLVGALVADVRHDARKLMRGPLDMIETRRQCLPRPYRWPIAPPVAPRALRKCNG